MATKLSIFIPDAEGWLAEALEAYRNAMVKERPCPTVSEVVREALRKHLLPYKPKGTDALLEATIAKRESGYGESEPWMF